MRKKSVPIRNNKRKKIYGNEFKKQMRIERFSDEKPVFTSLLYEPIKEMNNFFIQKQEISKRIEMMPKEIQKRIYIFAMKKYWREGFLNRSLKPIWTDYKKYMDNELKKCYFNNVHFMHLECNIIPELKEWIPGCQCDFCKKDTKVDNEIKDYIYDKIYTGMDGGYFFSNYIHCYDYFLNDWNQYTLFFSNMSQFKIFDPLKGYCYTIHDNIHEDPNESPIYFSYEIENS